MYVPAFERRVSRDSVAAYLLLERWWRDGGGWDNGNGGAQLPRGGSESSLAAKVARETFPQRTMVSDVLGINPEAASRVDTCTGKLPVVAMKS